jgi:membrane-associated phospholipid phosphatase
LRALGVIYPFTTGFAVLATGNHYVLDILGGVLLAALAIALVWVLRPGGRAFFRERSALPETAFGS